MFQRICTCAVLGATVYLTGCASIVNGRNQPVAVETRTASGAISGANCKLSNNKGTWYLTSPGSTTVHRSYENLAVYCTKEAHEPGLVTVKSSTKPMAFGNIIFGGLIGAAVDMGNGSAYDYPPLVAVEMGKTLVVPAAPAAAQAPEAAAPLAAR